jgi:formiminotetrahydrofolate cyclodeaminase
VTEKKDMLALSVREFVSRTAAKQPTPGGGSVAGVVGALGAALGEMALHFTKGKKKYAQHEDYYAELGPRLEEARTAFEDLVADDVAAYELYQAAARMNDDDPDKPEATKRALAAAINVPRAAAERALSLLEDLRQFVDRCSPWLISDLVASAALAVAALRLSDYNVRINARQIADEKAAGDLRAASAADVQRGLRLLEEIDSAAATHL